MVGFRVSYRENRFAMKKTTKSTPPLRVRPAVLAEQKLAAVIGGDEKTITSWNALPEPPRPYRGGWGSDSPSLER